MSRMRDWPSYVRSPGVLVLAALSLPTLLLVLTTAWQSGGRAIGLVVGLVAMGAFGNCLLAPLAPDVPRPDEQQ